LLTLGAPVVSVRQGLDIARFNGRLRQSGMFLVLGRHSNHPQYVDICGKFSSTSELFDAMPHHSDHENALLSVQIHMNVTDLPVTGHKFRNIWR
jgi:hypothetical protein